MEGSILKLIFIELWADKRMGAWGAFEWVLRWVKALQELSLTFFLPHNIFQL